MISLGDNLMINLFNNLESFKKLNKLTLIMLIFFLTSCNQLPMGSEGSQYQSCIALRSVNRNGEIRFWSDDIRNIYNIDSDNGDIEWYSNVDPTRSAQYQRGTFSREMHDLVVCESGENSDYLDLDNLAKEKLFSCSIYFYRKDGLHAYPVSNVVSVFQTRYMGTKGSWELFSLDNGLLRFGFVESVFCEALSN